MTELLVTGPQTGPLLLLAHGAGAGMSSPFMDLVSRLLAEREIGVARFEFGYMAQRRVDGKRRPPPKAEKLSPEFEAAMVAVRDRWPGRRLVIGGKSMGGRIASYLADAAFAEGRCAGLVCLGYPFHPPGKPTELRTAHLETIGCPTLIVQGERDPFGGRAEVAQLPLSRSICLHWAGDGDHDLGPRGGSGFTRKGNLAAAADAVRDFISGL
jgi:predicted alpha/beta-hydrolase family hydrolase